MVSAFALDLSLKGTPGHRNMHARCNSNKRAASPSKRCSPLPTSVQYCNVGEPKLLQCLHKPKQSIYLAVFRWVLDNLATVLREEEDGWVALQLQVLLCVGFLSSISIELADLFRSTPEANIQHSISTISVVTKAQLQTRYTSFQRLD